MISGSRSKPMINWIWIQIKIKSNIFNENVSKFGLHKKDKNRQDTVSKKNEYINLVVTSLLKIVFLNLKLTFLKDSIRSRFIHPGRLIVTERVLCPVLLLNVSAGRRFERNHGRDQRQTLSLPIALCLCQTWMASALVPSAFL